MKSLIFAVVLLMVGTFSLPVLAQQQDLQEIMNATNALGARQNELLGKKDAAGIASLFTSDGLLVMLAPQFAFKPGRDAIQKHYQGIIDAGASNITLKPRTSNCAATMAYGQRETIRSPSKTRPLRAIGLGYLSVRTGLGKLLWRRSLAPMR